MLIGNFSIEVNLSVQYDCLTDKDDIDYNDDDHPNVMNEMMNFARCYFYIVLFFSCVDQKNERKIIILLHLFNGFCLDLKANTLLSIELYLFHNNFSFIALLLISAIGMYLPRYFHAMDSNVQFNWKSRLGILELSCLNGLFFRTLS